MTHQVHHYCSTSVFLSIIAKKQIWLTALSQSNDHLEGKWMLQHWLDLFDRSNEPNRHLLKKGARIAVENTLYHNIALGTCFSEDSDLLSQWRGYADDGAGFSISFDKSGLEDLAAEDKSGLSLSMSKISYGYINITETNLVVKILSDAFGEDAKKYREGNDGVGDLKLRFTPEKYKIQKDAARRLFTVKNRAFSEEKEWRLFAYDSISNLRGVEFRESRGAISPFVKLAIPINIIRGVTLGPTNKTPIKIIEEALKVYGIECHVSRSSASYRAS